MNDGFTASLTSEKFCQLGYIVYGGVSNKEGVRSLVFTAQSSVADADVLTEKIFTFMNDFSLKDISDKQVYERGGKRDKDKEIERERARERERERGRERDRERGGGGTGNSKPSNLKEISDKACARARARARARPVLTEHAR